MEQGNNWKWRINRMGREDSSKIRNLKVGSLQRVWLSKSCLSVSVGVRLRKAGFLWPLLFPSAELGWTEQQNSRAPMAIFHPYPLQSTWLPKPGLKWTSGKGAGGWSTSVWWAPGGTAHVTIPSRAQKEGPALTGLLQHQTRGRGGLWLKGHQSGSIISNKQMGPQGARQKIHTQNHCSFQLVMHI